MFELKEILHELDILQQTSNSRSLITVVKKLAQLKKSTQGIVTIDIDYKANPSLAFSAREIASFNYQHQDNVIDIVICINFFGLQSVNSPLPLNLHEMLIHDVSADSYELNDFYDFFNHRMIELLAGSYTQRDVLNSDASTANIWSNILGLATQLYRDDQYIFHRLMTRADLLFSARHSAINIAKIIEVFFDFEKVYVENFVPRTVILSDDNQTKLGGQNSGLNESFVMGSKVVDIQNKCTLHIELEDVTDYLPNGNKYDLLYKLTKFLLANHLIYDFALHLKNNIKMVLRQNPLCLGWTTMLANHQDTIPQTIRLGEQH